MVLVGLYGDYWWNTGRFLVTTDDAYVQVHSALIAPQVSGYIIAVPVDDNRQTACDRLPLRTEQPPPVIIALYRENFQRENS